MTETVARFRWRSKLAWSLRRLGRFSPEDVRSRYLTWFLRRGTDTGPVSAWVLDLISFGVEPADAVAQVHRELKGLTGGCNFAHRPAPLAMCLFIADDELPAMAIQEAKLTHEHELAGDVSAAVILLCRALIRDGVERCPGTRCSRSPAGDPSSYIACNQTNAEVRRICSGPAARRDFFSSIGIPHSMRLFQMLCVSQVRQTTVRSWWAQSPVRAGVRPRLP